MITKDKVTEIFCIIDEFEKKCQIIQNGGPAATNCRESSVAFYRLRR